MSRFATVEAHRCVTDGTEDHRSRPFILAITVLTRVLVILIISVWLLLGIAVAVRVGCKLLLISRVEFVVIRLEGLIRTFCKDQHILEGTRPMHEYFLSDMCLKTMQKQMFCGLHGNLGRTQVNHCCSKQCYISLYRRCLTYVKQFIAKWHEAIHVRKLWADLIQ